MPLACNFKNITKALNGELNCDYLAENIENYMLHFQYASKDNEDNQPKTNKEYIKFLQQFSDYKLEGLYSILCELTHPSSKSVSCFTVYKEKNEFYSYSQILVDNMKVADEIIKDYEREIYFLLHISTNLPLLCLKVLNLFKVDFVYTDYIEKSTIVKQFLPLEQMEEILKVKEQGVEYFKNNNMEYTIDDDYDDTIIRIKKKRQKK